MRGFDIIIGFVLGNEKAREWCWKKICQASLIIDERMKQIKKGEKKDGECENDGNRNKSC